MPIIKINRRVISIEAIRRALYDLDMNKPIDVNEDDDNYILLINDDFNFTEDSFYKIVFENQLRIDVEKRTYKIRDIITAQAFSPIENIEDVLNKIHDK